jgi:hypothetical protein
MLWRECIKLPFPSNASLHRDGSGLHGLQVANRLATRDYLAYNKRARNFRPKVHEAGNKLRAALERIQPCDPPRAVFGLELFSCW